MSHIVSGFTPRILDANGNPATYTGGTTEQIMRYVNVPYMGPNSALQFDLLMQEQASAAGPLTLVVRILTGTVAGATSGTALIGGTVGTNIRQRFSGLIANQGVTTSQKMFANAAGAFTATTAAMGSSAVDTSSPFTVSFNLTLGNAADTASMLYFNAILLPR